MNSTRETGTSVAPTRVLSVDVLRGLTIGLMILVNDPGDPGEVYPALTHAEWNGYTAADLVFPNFLFLAGASLVFSLSGRIDRGRESRWLLARDLARRSLNLVLLKLALAAIPTLRLRRIRIFGVLFRIALCSLVAGLMLLRTRSLRTLLCVVAGLLIGYWALLRLVPIPGVGQPVRDQPLLDPDNNLAAWLDRKIAHLFHGHLHTGALFNVTHDPEGLLSSLPAVASTLIGSAAAVLMRLPGLTGAEKGRALAGAGAASLAAGHLWHRRLPINKNLWTSSHVLASSGWSLLALSALYWLYDLEAIERRLPAVRALTAPARIFGANALVAYAVSVAGHKIARTVHLPLDGHSVSLRTYAYRRTFARSRSTPLRSLAFAAAYAALCFVPNLLLWRRKIFVKI